MKWLNVELSLLLLVSLVAFAGFVSFSGSDDLSGNAVNDLSGFATTCGGPSFGTCPKDYQCKQVSQRCVRKNFGKCTRYSPVYGCSYVAPKPSPITTPKPNTTSSINDFSISDVKIDVIGNIQISASRTDGGVVSPAEGFNAAIEIYDTMKVRKFSFSFVSDFLKTTAEQKVSYGLVVAANVPWKDWWYLTVGDMKTWWAPGDNMMWTQQGLKPPQSARYGNLLPGDYSVVAYLYCANDNSACAKNYGVKAVRTKIVPLKINAMPTPTPTPKEIYYLATDFGCYGYAENFELTTKDKTCKHPNEWRQYANKVCKDFCDKQTGKCGVNGWGILYPCT